MVRKLITSAQVAVVSLAFGQDMMLGSGEGNFRENALTGSIMAVVQKAGEDANVSLAG